MPLRFIKPGELGISLWTRTFAASIADDDAIKTSIATAATVQTYSGGGLNGVVAGTEFKLPQLLSITTTTSVGTYVTASPIVVTGEDSEGAVITESIALTQANGNETVFGIKPFFKVTSIAVPAQANTGGTFKFGVGDILLPGVIREMRAGIDGTIKCGYQSQGNDTVTLKAGERHSAYVDRIYSTGTSAYPLTVYA